MILSVPDINIQYGVYILELVEEWLATNDDCRRPSVKYGTVLLSPRLAVVSANELLGRDCIADGSARKYIGIESGTDSRPDRPVFLVSGGETLLLLSVMSSSTDR